MTSQQQQPQFVNPFADDPSYKNDGVHNRLLNHEISSIHDPNLRGIDSRFHNLIANHENYETQDTPLDDDSIVVLDNRDEDDMEELEGENDPEVEAIKDEEEAIDPSTLKGRQLKFYKRGQVENLLAKELTDLTEHKISKNCSEVHFRHKNPIKRTVLTSFPGSGNTWLRHLVHMSTGYHTGSFYSDGVLLYEGGFLGESLMWTDDRVVGIKVHKFGTLSSNAHRLGFQPEEIVPKAVLMIRSPYRAILSEYNRERSHGHTSSVKNKFDYRDKQWSSFFERFIVKWEYSIRLWLETYKGKVHVMCYEEVVKDPPLHVRSMVRFMGINFNRPFCVQGNSEGNFKRKPSKQDYAKYFTAGHRMLADQSIQRIKDLLKVSGQPPCTEYFDYYWDEAPLTTQAPLGEKSLIEEMVQKEKISEELAKELEDTNENDEIEEDSEDNDNPDTLDNSSAIAASPIKTESQSPTSFGKSPHQSTAVNNFRESIERASSNVAADPNLADLITKLYNQKEQQNRFESELLEKFDHENEGNSPPYGDPNYLERTSDSKTIVRNGRPLTSVDVLSENYLYFIMFYSVVGFYIFCKFLKW